MKRTVFFVSDSTGITVESLGRSVLAQFNNVEFSQHMLAFVDTPEKVENTVRRIRDAADEDGARPIVFYTFGNESLAVAIKESGALLMNCLDTFIRPLEDELGIPAAHSSGLSHSMREKDYQRRMDALNFAMDFDDGAAVRGLERAELILIGVSRSGKTPTSLYLAMHFGIYAANYPLVDEDLASADHLPAPLANYQHKLFGLTIAPVRLAQIREQRRPGSRYAEPSQCEQEVRAALRLYKKWTIPYYDATRRSVEELASKILKKTGLLRRAE